MEPFVTALPDVPRWVETRGMLLAGRGRVVGIEPASPGTAATPAGAVLQPDTRLGVVIGRPGAAMIREVARLADDLLAAPEDAAWVAGALPEWTSEPATLHVLPSSGGPTLLPDPPGANVRLLEPGELDAIPGLPAELRDDLAIETRAGTPIAAEWVGALPVAFCYAGSVTDTWWDASIDTLEPYRHQGHASRCVAYMIRRYAQAEKRPVWGAVASNEASVRLAAKLGFEPVDSLVVFSRGINRPEARAGRPPAPVLPPSS